MKAQPSSCAWGTPLDYRHSMLAYPLPTHFASTIEKMMLSSAPTALPARQRKFLFAALSLLLVCTATLHAQDWFKTETSSGASNIRIAVADQTLARQ